MTQRRSFSFDYTFSVWKLESPSVQSGAPADFTAPFTVISVSPDFPNLDQICTAILSMYGLSSAQLVRFTHSSGMIVEYWHPTTTL